MESVIFNYQKNVQVHEIIMALNVYIEKIYNINKMYKSNKF